jgi:hypothetical protein
LIQELRSEYYDLQDVCFFFPIFVRFPLTFMGVPKRIPTTLNPLSDSQECLDAENGLRERAVRSGLMAQRAICVVACVVSALITSVPHAGICGGD